MSDKYIVTIDAKDNKNKIKYFLINKTKRKLHNLINNHMKQQVEIEHNRNAKQFNRIVKNDMDMHRNKYIKRQILKKIDVIITNKMYSMIKNQGA